MKWIDIVSPGLKKLHQTWVGFRGTRLMVHVGDYNRFLGHAAADKSLSVILPADGSSPVVKHAGADVRQAIPNLWSGLRFEDITSTVSRTVIATPFHSVAAGRQPDVRRGSWRNPAGEVRSYEQLLLPFDNDQLRVCVVHAVFEIGRVQRMAA
jgi:hypothetical protein